MLIYKLLRRDEWAALQRDGESLGAPVDLADGYVHFSTATQIAETARRHFAGVEGLELLAYEADAFGPALRWEPSRGGDLFPHLYATLRHAEIVWHRTLTLGPDGHDIGTLP